MLVPIASIETLTVQDVTQRLFGVEFFRACFQLLQVICNSARIPFAASGAPFLTSSLRLFNNCDGRHINRIFAATLTDVSSVSPEQPPGAGATHLAE